MEALMRGVDPKTARKQLRLKREEEEQQRQALHVVQQSGTAALKVLGTDTVSVFARN